MARTVRLNKPTPVRREPVGMVGWNKLLQAAIAGAERTSDKKLTALKAARDSGKAAETLKRYGIICEADIQREFPQA